MPKLVLPAFSQSPKRPFDLITHIIFYQCTSRLYFTIFTCLNQFYLRSVSLLGQCDAVLYYIGAFKCIILPMHALTLLTFCQCVIRLCDLILHALVCLCTGHSSVPSFRYSSPDSLKPSCFTPIYIVLVSLTPEFNLILYVKESEIKSFFQTSFAQVSSEGN